ncbi:glycosyl transferase family 9 [Denitrovibrio acetiphilus DSM 12809]|uniref:Glycosyl transferase family 9 n=1 Tax=Denitrovibrio acetiphilus (strain DSM 12809 / NBRC 114555 / N2460) TaxID=522772 RepID=D4H0Z5_DENA2|nr:glycosyltransferase family 9 protein [Denitrovibrio acetiphilus]ADD68658.1 glycosyl transferase family 9 [Denitrovibrio acetiphilus DSM 12809]
MKKWLIIQFKQIGDVILTTQLPREIRKLYPQAEVDFLTFSMNKDLLTYNPNIRNVLTVPSGSGFISTIRSALAVRNGHYDVILDTQNTPRSMYSVLFSGAEYKVGFRKSKRRFAYNTFVSSKGAYAGLIKLNMLKSFDTAFSADKYDCSPEVFYTQADKVSMVQKAMACGLKLDKPYITMAPTHKKVTRRWKLKHFADTANWLAETKDLQVVLTYGPGERDYITSGLEGMRLHRNIIVAPPLTLLELAALMSGAEMHIGNDSAPHHMAVSQKTPTFVVIGSTSSGWVHPHKRHTYINLGLDCQPCRSSICRISDEIPCMNDLTFEMIKPELDKFISENKIG